MSPAGGPYEVGDVLTCVSDGFPEPSYTWTDEDGVVVSTGPRIIVANSSFVLNCTATGNLTDACNATVQVRGSGRPTELNILSRVNTSN